MGGWGYGEEEFQFCGGCAGTGDPEGTTFQMPMQCTADPSVEAAAGDMEAAPGSANSCHVPHGPTCLCTLRCATCTHVHRTATSQYQAESCCGQQSVCAPGSCVLEVVINARLLCIEYSLLQLCF